MKIMKPAKAGTFESNDIYVTVMPSEGNGIELELESIVMQQFGDEIKMVIMDTLKELGVQDVIIRAQDKGALNYTIKARVETAVKRGCE
ncbi:citrate lyase acyl carrier protein [Oceanirhabdus sp. W0125-5]|uniref:citrate lyase acyl carrier protein n=1 Tax=Oceanirhabdus sp. W0125-5 TaxID=2999116 RepID=UPI0022F2EF12|nr:citrate lyase acyl carrier protein [Oceanirhabdus sp. W0125-5]WBW98039.1 citrate lyase acyl carrier protein [Oceanirhabdus sp. W0125-5]